MVNFYEALDEVFDKLIENKQDLFDDLVQIKSDIITAYEKSHDYERTYMSKLLKVKHFKITEDGQIVSV